MDIEYELTDEERKLVYKNLDSYVALSSGKKKKRTRSTNIGTKPTKQ